jgi:hypothetical protein
MVQMVSYIRVSTGKQGKSGFGIEAHREAIARFAAAEGYEALAEVVEVETGKGAMRWTAARNWPRRWPRPARPRHRWWWPSRAACPATLRSSQA